MRRWMVLPLLLTLLFAAPPARAAKIGVYFDEAATDNRLQVDAGRPFKFFIVVSGVPTLAGWESVVEVDPRLTVTARSLRGPSPIEVGEGEDNWVVGFSRTVSASAPYAVVEYAAVLVAAEEGLWIGLSPAINPNEQAQAPQYLDGESTVREFDEIAGAVINTEVGSWGELKDSYQGR